MGQISLDLSSTKKTITLSPFPIPYFLFSLVAIKRVIFFLNKHLGR